MKYPYQVSIRRQLQVYFLISLVLAGWQVGACSTQTNWGMIAGLVVDEKNNPLAGVNIILVGTTQGTASDRAGSYRLERIKPGEYTLKFMSIGYRPEIRNAILIQAGETTWLNVTLIEAPLDMQAIVVTPGNFSISQQQTAKLQMIQKERIESIPASLNDICRVVQIMPGVTFSDDYSAHFHVRGGKQSENLILLDGMEIFDPYHLKHIGGAVGVMNMDLIEDIAILTGGFSARYGDKLSSVVTLKNRSGYAEKFRGNIGGGGTGASLILEGPCPRGSWIFSFRKSFLKEAAEILNPTDYTFSPSFYDVQSKLAFSINPNNQVLVNFLYSRDDTYLEKWRQDSELYSNYGNGYYGLVWNSVLSTKLFSELIISRGQNFWDNRIGKDKEEQLDLTENVVNWNVNYQPHLNYEMELGASYKYILYDYELTTPELSMEQSEVEELIESYYGSTKLHPRTYKYAFYGLNKFKLLGSFFANIGMRYDYFEYNRDHQWSPRIGLAYSLGRKTIVRAAWGQYNQAPVYTELARQKGATINPRSEQAFHYVLGLEHFLTNSTNIRIEGYSKILRRMVGHYLEMSDSTNQPVLHYGNPNNGTCKGIEFFLNGKLGQQLSLWLSYAYSVSKIEAYFVDWEQLAVVKKTIPRFTDQPHSFSCYMTYQLPHHWELNLKWRYLSGIPYTARLAKWDSNNNPYWGSGEPNSARYPAYHRLDVRFGKKFNFQKYKLATFLEIKNVYNQKNVFLYDYNIQNGSHQRQAYYMLPILPTIEFNFIF